MLWIALTVALVLLAGALIVLIMPWRLRLSLKGRGELGKFWVIALGAELGPATLSLANGHGVDSVLQLHLFGRKLFRASPVLKRSVGPKGEPEALRLDDQIQAWRGRAERWFDLGEVLRYVVVDVRRQIRMERFEGRLVYSTPDVALTGILSGQLYTIAGLLSPFGSFRVEPQWMDIGKIDGSIQLAFRFSPGRMAINALVFTFKNIKLRQREADAAPAGTKTMGGHHAR